VSRTKGYDVCQEFGKVPKGADERG